MTFREPDAADTFDEEPRAVSAILIPTPRAELRGPDPIALYLREIGSVPLLTPGQEVEVCRRIEEAQVALRRAVAGVPRAVERLLEVEGRLRRGDVSVDEVIVLGDGTEPTRRDTARLLAALARVRRLAGAARRSAVHRAAIQEIVGALPLLPSLVDDLVALVRDGAVTRRDARLLAEVERRDAAVRQAKKQLMEANLRLVVAVAKRYLSTDFGFGDLIQEGNVGLMKAVDRFQYRRGFKFSTYATWWIRQSITRAIADHARVIRMPVHLVETLNRISRADRALSSRLGRAPTVEELGEHVGVTPRKVRLILEAARRPVSLETPVGDDSELADFVEDPTGPRQEHGICADELRVHIERAFATLSPKEKAVMRLRFGMTDEGEQTLEEVGTRFAVTRERIRQIEAKALRKLRRPLRSRHLRAFLV